MAAETGASASPANRRKRELLGLAALVLIALALRLPNLGQSVWFDEACMSKQRIGTVAQLLVTIYVDVHPPAFLGFMHLWNGLFGDSEVAMRLPALLCGLASLLLAYRVGRRLVGGPASGWAVVFLCASPAHIWYSIEARLYAPMVLLTLAAVELTHRLLDPEPGRRVWMLHALVTAMLCAVHYYLAVYGLLLGAIGWGLARARRRPAVARRIAWTHGGCLALLAVWVAIKLALAEFATAQGYLRPFTLLEGYRFFFQWCWTGNGLPAGLENVWTHPRGLLWIAFQGLGAVLAVRGAWWLLRARRTRGRGLLTLAYLLCIPAFLLVLRAAGREHTYIERSVLPAAPFLFMLAGAGIHSIARARLRAATAAVVLAFAVGNLAAYYHFDDEVTVYKPHPDWRAAAAYLGDEIDAGGAGRPVFTSFPNPRSLSYYDDRIQVAHNLAPAPQAVAQAERKLVRVFGASAGATLAAWARSVAGSYEQAAAERLVRARLLVHPAESGDPDDLRLAERRSEDRILYLIRNHRHPPGDRTVTALAAHPRFRRLEAREFRALTVTKLQEVPQR